VELSQWPDGSTNETYDPETGEYVFFTETGEVFSRFPFGKDGDSHVSNWEANGGEVRNGVSLRYKVAAQVPDLLVMMTDLNARIDVPKADLSNRELRRTIRDVKQLARVVTQLVRLVGNVLDSTDSGN